MDDDKQVVAKVLGRNVTRGTLRKAFERVENKANWKMPIDATIDITSPREGLLIAEAVVFYTGSRATFIPQGGSRYKVLAIGYYAAVGA